MSHDSSLTKDVLSAGRTVYHARLNNSTEAKFVIGYKTVYDGMNFGLFNTDVKNGQEVYDPALFVSQFDFWAFFIYPTAMAESKGSYWCLNTYDRAKFTFSFMQHMFPTGILLYFLKNYWRYPMDLIIFPGWSYKTEGYSTETVTIPWTNWKAMGQPKS